MKMIINISVYICIFLPSISWAGLYSPLMNDFLEKNFDINEVRFGKFPGHYLDRIAGKLIHRKFMSENLFSFFKIGHDHGRPNRTGNPYQYEFWYVERIFGTRFAGTVRCTDYRSGFLSVRYLIWILVWTRSR